MKVSYVAHIFEEDDEFSAEFPDIKRPEAFANSDSFDTTKKCAEHGLKRALLALRRENAKFPEAKTNPDESKGFYAIEVEIPDE